MSDRLVGGFILTGKEKFMQHCVKILDL